MKKSHTGLIAAGKGIRSVLRLRGGGGSALPGLITEKLSPNFLSDILNSLPEGVVIVTGTNGKTTTTKIISDIATSLGKKVLTNNSGSNFSRGIIASIIEQSKVGRSLDKDIAVIELDEAHARKFVRNFKPRYVVALNVMRDQLDRFGEIDVTAGLIEEVLKSATDGCIINADDPRLVEVSRQLSVNVSYYGVNETIRKHFPIDEELVRVGQPNEDKPRIKEKNLSVELTSFGDHQATYKINKNLYTSRLKLNGIYNYQNAAAALALLQLILPNVIPVELTKRLEAVSSAFGRGEKIELAGKSVDLILVKNPAGFRLALASFKSPATLMIAINDNDADGRDVSWLWDVDFSNLKVDVVSGIRAYDMALRLHYDNIEVAKVETNISKALNMFLESNDNNLRIYCTYTAMLKLRALLSKKINLVRPL